MAFRIVVLISGGGTTLRNLIEHHCAGKLAVEMVHVISSRADAGGLKYAQEYRIPYSVVDPKNHPDINGFSDSLFDVCRQAQADLVVMGGFLKQVLIPSDFVNRVINIHPSLIPAFCGKGMYGSRVHSAVIEYGCKLTGCTVHFVDNEYDHGPIIAQRAVPVLNDDTSEALSHRVFEAECRLYPEIINSIANSKVAIEGRKLRIK